MFSAGSLIERRRVVARVVVGVWDGLVRIWLKRVEQGRARLGRLLVHGQRCFIVGIDMWVSLLIFLLEESNVVSLEFF